MNDGLARLDAGFEAICTDFGRPSIAPERLMRASLIQIPFSVRSERQLMEQVQDDLMFRWFVGLGIGEQVWGEGAPGNLSGGQVSALNGRSPGPKTDGVHEEPRPAADHRDVAAAVMAAILAHREVAPLLSDEHFSVDGTLVRAWASTRAFSRRQRARRRVMTE